MRLSSLVLELVSTSSNQESFLHLLNAYEQLQYKTQKDKYLTRFRKRKAELLYEIVDELFDEFVLDRDINYAVKALNLMGRIEDEVLGPIVKKKESPYR